jgi:hypothetical protein
VYKYKRLIFSINVVAFHGAKVQKKKSKNSGSLQNLQLGSFAINLLLYLLMAFLQLL